MQLMSFTALILSLLALQSKSATGNTFHIEDDDQLEDRSSSQPFNLANLQKWRSAFANNNPDGHAGDSNDGAVASIGNNDENIVDGQSSDDINVQKLIEKFLLMQQERNRKEQRFRYYPTDNGISFDEYYSEPDLESNQPYGIQNVRDIATRSTSSAQQTSAKRFKTTFQSLCPSERISIFLNLDSDYEYRPDHYEEVVCVHPYSNIREYATQNNKICGEAGFACIQLNRTVFLTRRLYGTNCWESETRIVAAGCECMWPKHHLGDIVSHH